MRGREGESSSRISPTSLSVKTVFFLSLVLLLRLTVTDIISKAVSGLCFPCLGKYLILKQLVSLWRFSMSVNLCKCLLHYLFSLALQVIVNMVYLIY